MEQSTARQPHRLVLENRKKSMISGVQDVQSFHEQEILLLTEEGKLQIKGEGLHVKRLNLEKGEADIEGKINSLIYLSRNTPKTRKTHPNRSTAAHGKRAAVLFCSV